MDCKEQFWWGANYYVKQLPDDGSWFVWDKTAGKTHGQVPATWPCLLPMNSNLCCDRQFLISLIL